MTYNTFKLKNKNKDKSMTEICKPKKFNLQIHQKFLKKYFSDKLKKKNHKMLLFHGLGSGKTCTAISIAKELLLKKIIKKKIMIVTPASLIPNFMKELNSNCGYGNVLNTKQNVNPCDKTKEIIKTKTNPIIEHNFDIMSYQKFIKLSKQNKLNLRNRLLIIDEVQNIISEESSMYKIFLLELVKKNPLNMSLLLLTGTPMFDKINELSLIANLMLNVNDKPLPTGNEFIQKFRILHLQKNRPSNSYKKIKHELIKYFKNKISFFKGVSPNAYPKISERIVSCPMSEYQYKKYKNSVGDMNLNLKENNKFTQHFFISPRQISNIALTNKQNIRSVLKKNELKKHSGKFHNCIKKINNSKGPVFVYSNFVKKYGINDFAEVLIKHKYTKVTESVCPIGKGKRFAIFKTDNQKENNRILNIFNSYQNKDGSLIKVILGSPTMKEGVSLLRVRQVHILDPYWNKSRTNQIIGRAVRFCSHKDLPKTERNVRVYHYISTLPGTKTNNINKLANEQYTVDAHLIKMSNKKHKQIETFEKILKEIAIDCHLFKNKNNNYKCITSNNQNNINKNNKVNISQYKKNLRPLNKEKKEKIGNIKKLGIINFNKLKNKNKLSIKKSKNELQTTNDPYIEKSKSFKNKKKYSCPKKRLPVMNKCSSTFPFKKDNKYGISCCYKKGHVDIKSIKNFIDKNSKGNIIIKQENTNRFKKCMNMKKNHITTAIEKFPKATYIIKSSDGKPIKKLKKKLCEEFFNFKGK